MHDLTITLMQASLAWKDKKQNLLKFGAWIEGLAEKPDLIVLPEMFSTGFVVEPFDIAIFPGGSLRMHHHRQPGHYRKR
jgi:omega-amidase